MNTAVASPASAGAASAPLFALRGLGKQFGSGFACRGVDLDIWPGEVVGLVGENGAGKSTTMKCLAGHYSLSEGRIEVKGVPVEFKAPRDAEAAGIAIIPQELDLFPELTVVENLFMGREWPRTAWGGFDHAAMRRRAEELFALLGVSIDVLAAVKSLSPANGKLVEIARALNRDATVLIMDEPTAALTEREVKRLFTIIRDLRKRGTAIIHITHRLDEIFEICDRVLVLRDGEVVKTGATSELDAASLVRAMVGRPVAQFYTRVRRDPGPVVLEINGLTRDRVYSDVSFSLHAGEILGVAGLIGAGRSEVAHAICGVRPADHGTVAVDGAPIAIRSVADGRRARIAYLPEERRSQGLHLSYPVSWNLTFAALDRFVRLGVVQSVPEMAFAADAASRFTVRGARLDEPVARLSGGNQQKVLLAKVLALDPKIIILDEPTRGVDVGAKAEIYGLIDGLVQHGMAVLLISSEMDEIRAMSDRVMVMYEGRVVSIFGRGEFTQENLGHAASGQWSPNGH